MTSLCSFKKARVLSLSGTPPKPMTFSAEAPYFPAKPANAHPMPL